MSCAGKYARIIEYIEGEVSAVHAFSDSIKPINNVTTVNVAFAYNADDGQVFILRLNHCLDFTSQMQHSILCANQYRAHNNIVDDTPKYLITMKNQLNQLYTAALRYHFP